MNKNKRLGLTAICAAGITLLFHLTNSIDNTDILIAYMITYFFLNKHFSE